MAAGKKKGGLDGYDLFNAIRDSHLVSGAHQSVLFTLATRANSKRNFYAFTSLRRLAEDSQRDVSTVQRVTSDLVKAGLIRRKVIPHHVTQYWVCADFIYAKAEEKRNARKAAKGLVEAEELGDITVSDDTDAHYVPQAYSLPDDDYIDDGYDGPEPEDCY